MVEEIAWSVIDLYSEKVHDEVIGYASFFFLFNPSVELSFCLNVKHNFFKKSFKILTF